VLAVRHVGPYPEIPKAIEKLFSIAGPAGLVNFPETQLLGVFHDDPNAVEASKLRSDACITVPAGTEPLEGTHVFSIPGGKFAVARAELDQSQYGDVWHKLVGEWIPSQELTPDEGRICYEVYMNDPQEHPEGKHIVDVCEPVK